MEDLMDFIPSGWKRDLIHMVGCFYTSQIAPFNSRQWHSDRDKFIRATEERKDREWLDIKEWVPLATCIMWPSAFWTPLATS